MKKLLLIVLSLTLTMGTMAQDNQQWLDKKLSISVKEMSLEQVLKELEKDMEGVVFAYSPGTFDVKKKVSIELRSVPLNEILQQVFANQNLECAEMRGKIFLKKRKVKRDKSKAPLAKSAGPITAAAGNEAVPDITTTQKQRRVGSPVPTRQSPVGEATVSVPSSDSTATPGEPQEVNKPSVALRPSPAISALVAELTAADRERSAPVRRAVKPIEKDRAFAGMDKYQPQSFGLPDLPPVPIDSSRLVIGSGEDMSKEKDKKRKKKPDREPEEKKLRLYGASTTALTGIGGDPGIKMGGRAVWLKNSRFGVGLAGYAIQGSRAEDPALSNDAYRLAGGYGGLLLEYNLNPHKAIHLSFPVVIAGGAMSYVQNDLNPGNLGRGIEDERIMAIIEPGAMLEFNVIKFVKVAFDLSYRYATHTELNYQDSGEVILPGNGLNTFSGGVTVKFGIF
jgi:hypothetical protein